MNVIKSEFLPVPEMFKASDLSTRQEVSIPSGKMIHCISLEGRLIVSPELYSKLAESALKTQPMDYWWRDEQRGTFEIKNNIQ